MSVHDRVIEIIQSLCGSETVELADNLLSELSFDSLMMVTLLLELEECFDIELDESDMNPFALETVEQVILLMEKYAEKTKQEET